MIFFLFDLLALTYYYNMVVIILMIISASLLASTSLVLKLQGGAAGAWRIGASSMIIV